MSRFAALWVRDARGIRRDAFLVFLCLYVPALAVGLRAGLPVVAIGDLDLYLAPWVVVFGGTSVGMIFGFQLVEERESGAAVALRVTPLSPGDYFAYLSLTTGVLGFALGGVAAVLYGLPVRSLPHFLVALAASAAIAPLAALFLGAIARNTVEALALAKVGSMLSLTPALLFVLPPAWQTLLAWSPHYWVTRALLRAYASDERLAALPLYWAPLPAWLDPLAAVALCAVATGALARLALRRVE